MKKRVIALLSALVLLLGLIPTAQAGYIDSEWVHESEMPEGAQLADEKWIVKTMTYQVKEGDPEMEGFIIDRTDWEKRGSPTVTYYADIPSGFNTSAPAFQLYWRKWGRQTGYQQEFEKVVVSSSWETYIYWHWMYDCGGANGHAKRAILDYNGWGPDNGYLYKYFAMFASKNGNYASDRYYCNSRSILNYIVPERTSYSETMGATRWFRFSVNRDTAQKFVRMHYGHTYSEQECFDPNQLPKAGTVYTKSEGDENNRIDTVIERYVRYKIEAEDVATPQANFPDGSALKPGDEITLSCATPDATILYTIAEDFSDPQPADAYTGPFKVLDKESFTVSARAVKEGMADSETVFFTYHIGNLQGFPKVTTLEASEISETSARLSCKVESTSRVLQTQFSYYEKGGNLRQYTVPADSNGEYLLEDLMPGTEYWFQARATNLSGQSSGNVCSFRTKGTAGRTPSSISLSPSYAAITPGGTRQLLATVLPAISKRDVVWSSEDENVATVDEHGKVTAVGRGLTHILATTVLGRIQAACTVEVFSNPDVTGDKDFSEYNMMMACSEKNEDCGFDFHALRGGNSQMASAYLARWDGAVAEVNDPYPSGIIDVYHRKESDLHVQEILYLPWRTGPLDNDEIKNAVMKYGAVYVALRTGVDYRNNNDKDFYLPADRKGSKGHALAVVGWDDNYSRTNFSFTPPGDGAFICKNSWGADRGEDGYCYVSYYDSTFGMENSEDVNAVFYYAQTSDNYNKIYQYDELGGVDDYDFGSDSGWYANVFPRQGEALGGDEMLKAVSFYTVSPGTSYELYIVPNYQGPNSLCQLGEPVKSKSIDYAGYHTISLSEPVRLTKGTRFAVAVRITDKSGAASIFIEAPRVGISSKARAGAGESFVRGADGRWKDLTAVEENANVCLKAFTLTELEEEASVLEATPALSGSTRSYTQEELFEMSAGLNPAYLAALSGSGEETGQGQSDQEEPETGLVPPSILPNLNSSCHYAEGAQFPSRYDLREEGFVTTPVRDQQGYPACWAFAAYASLESCVLRAAGSGYSLVGGLNQAGEEEIYIQLNENDPMLDLSPGKTSQLSATIYPFDSDTVLFWESSDSSVAAVSPHGTVTAKKPGAAEITVSTEDKSVSASCTVNVLEEQPPQSLVISSPETFLTAGSTALLDQYTYPLPVDSTELTWESEDPEVATVDEYGLLTAVGRGTARIRATTADGTVSAECAVNVDSGEELVSAVAENGLTYQAGRISGDLTVSLRNRGSTRNMSLVLAFYAPSGQLLHSVLREETVQTGDSSICFSGLEFPGPAGVSFRVFSLTGDGGMTPLDLALSGTVSSHGQ